LVLSRRLQPLAVVPVDAAGKVLEVRSHEGLAELSHRSQQIKSGLSHAGITLAQAGGSDQSQIASGQPGPVAKHLGDADKMPIMVLCRK